MAVVEGVMMRCAGRWAVAVRNAEGGITVEEGAVPRWPAQLRSVPFVRGVVGLAESLTIGVRAMVWSTAQATGSHPRRPVSVGGTIALALLLVASVFFVLPATVARAVAADHGSVAFTAIEATLRLSLFLAYLWGISRIAEVRRLFGYHGAEHMAVSAFEAGVPLDVASARPYGTRHVRCGTTFMLVVMVLAVGVHAFVGSATWSVLVASRVVTLPVVAAVAYEMLAFADRHRASAFMRAVLVPGLALQAMTTRPPDDDQLEVAFVAIRAVAWKMADAPAGAGASVEVLPL